MTERDRLLAAATQQLEASTDTIRALVAQRDELIEALREVVAAHLKADPHSMDQCSDCVVALTAIAKAREGTL